MLHEGAKYWADPWHWVQTAIVAACRTHGLLPVDGPFGDFSDDEGFRAQARRSATLGMVGKWAIHPKQVALANEIFTPDRRRRAGGARDPRGDGGGQGPRRGRHDLQGAARGHRLDQAGRGHRETGRDDRRAVTGRSARLLTRYVAPPVQRCSGDRLSEDTRPRRNLRGRRNVGDAGPSGRSLRIQAIDDLLGSNAEETRFARLPSLRMTALDVRRSPAFRLTLKDVPPGAGCDHHVSTHPDVLGQGSLSMLRRDPPPLSRSAGFRSGDSQNRQGLDH